MCMRNFLIELPWAVLTHIFLSQYTIAEKKEPNLLWRAILEIFNISFLAPVVVNASHFFPPRLWMRADSVTWDTKTGPQKRSNFVPKQFSLAVHFITKWICFCHAGWTPVRKFHMEFFTLQKIRIQLGKCIAREKNV